jgi:enediyne biosynthesis protein E4
MLRLRTKTGSDAIGARIRAVLPDGTEQHAFVSTASSCLSANDPRVHLGLGKHRRVRSLEIMWPSGARQRVENIPGDQLRTLIEPWNQRQ